MNNPNKPMSLLDICLLFEVDPSTVPDMSRPGPLPEIEKKLETFKEIFKKAYRKLAIELHPDHGATEEQVERFKKMTAIYKDFQKIKVKPIPKPRPRPTVIIRTGGFGGSYSSSTTSGSWGGGTWYWSSSGGGGGGGTGE